MKRTYLIAALTALALVSGLPASMAQEETAPDERVLIEKAVRDYIDGWYEGDAERMRRALHPDLVKRRVVALPNGREVLDSVGADPMVEYTAMAGGKDSLKEGMHNEVTILDVSPQTASVKTVSHQFIDYLHLAKVNGQWRIVNVLWELNKQ
jgi:hypothetical protein